MLITQRERKFDSYPRKYKELSTNYLNYIYYFKKIKNRNFLMGINYKFNSQLGINCHPNHCFESHLRNFRKKKGCEILTYERQFSTQCFIFHETSTSYQSSVGVVFVITE
mgnify:CR=1 FL=1